MLHAHQLILLLLNRVLHSAILLGHKYTYHTTGFDEVFSDFQLIPRNESAKCLES